MILSILIKIVKTKIQIKMLLKQNKIMKIIKWIRLLMILKTNHSLKMRYQSRRKVCGCNFCMTLEFQLLIRKMKKTWMINLKSMRTKTLNITKFC